MRAAKKNSLADFNLNSILVIVAGVVVTWLVNNGLSTAKETKQATVDTKQNVAKIETALPFIADSQKRLENSLNQVQLDQKNLITRSELDNKHNRLLLELKDVRDEQTKVRDDLNKKRK